MTSRHFKKKHYNRRVA